MAPDKLMPTIGIEPVLISTSAGVVGAIVTLPGGEERGTAAILPGMGSTRSGLNRIWAMLASSLASVGVCSIRLDYPGTAESHLCRTDRWEEGTAEAIDWFRQRTEDPHLVLLAECAGLLPAYREVMRDPPLVSGVGLVIPPLAIVRLTQPPRSLYRRALTVPEHGKSFIRRMRYGQPDVMVRNRWPKEILLALVHSDDMLVQISSRVPLWVLSAAGDPSTSELLGLSERLENGVAYEFELAPPAVQGSSQFPGEREIVASTTAWVTRHFGLAGISALPSLGPAVAADAAHGQPTEEEPR
jgi:hypothetical protein